MPSTSCIVHGALGLQESALAFDYAHGCSGYIYGLALAKNYIETGIVNNVLLITTDTYSKYINQKDMRTKPLFGDAASATLLEGKESQRELLSNFKFGTNGKDYSKIIIHYGRSRMKYADYDLAHTDVFDQFGNARNDAHIYMDGKSVMHFTKTVVPKMVADILQSAKLDVNSIDNFIFHQANKVILDSLRELCNIPDTDKYWNDVSDIGNTASSSIPNAINKIQSVGVPLGKRGMLVGFGVGLSWAGCIADLTMIENPK